MSDIKSTEAAIAIVIRDCKVLICQRPADKSFSGYWEFPGGKREPHETMEQCLIRELREELGIQVRPIRAFAPITHDYPAGRVILHPYLCEHEAGQLQLLDCQDARWIEPADLRRYRFPPANESLIEEIIKWFQLTDRPARG